jgi:hypothetical protein
MIGEKLTTNANARIAIDIIIVVAIIFVLYKLMKVFSGVTNIAEEIVTNPATAGAENVGTQAGNALSTLATKGIKPTKTTAEMQSIANTIFNAGRVFNIGGIDTKPDVIYRELTKMQNDADVLLLIKLFGSQQRYTFGVPSTNPMDLFTFVKDVLGTNTPDNSPLTYVDLINKNWSRKSTPIKARL